MRRGLNMLCVISGGNWTNGAISGVWALNLNNVRSNSNTNYGFRSDSPPNTPHAVCTAWRRGSPRRALRRNVLLAHPLVSVVAHVGRFLKIGLGALA
jgi:hypothetical protein